MHSEARNSSDYSVPQSPDSLRKDETTITTFGQLVLHSSARNWGVWRKLYVSVGAIASFLVITLSTSIYIASIPGLMDEFQVGQTLAISPVTLYAMGFVIGPILTSALSEEFGRQYIYKMSLLLHFVATVVGGCARNFPTVAVSRAISGLVGSPSVTVFAGVLNDLWKMPDDKAAVPIFVFYGIGGAVAPEIGPLVGEAIVARHGWRASFWLTAILVGSCFVAMVFVPETFAPELHRRALPHPRRNLGEAIKRAIKRPVTMLREPIVYWTIPIESLGQAVIFVFYAGFPLVLQRVYRFSPYQVGLAFLPLLAGTLLVPPVLFLFDKRKQKRTSQSKATVEDILPGAMLGGFLMPMALFWLAWTVRPGIHWGWAVPAGVFYGFGFAISQIDYPMYKNEVYGADWGASAMAISVAMRYLLSSPVPLFTIQLIDRIGFGWSITTCALILTALGPVPFWLHTHGERLRGQSRIISATPQGEDNRATGADQIVTSISTSSV